MNQMSKSDHTGQIEEQSESATSQLDCERLQQLRAHIERDARQSYFNHSPSTTPAMNASLIKMKTLPISNKVFLWIFIGNIFIHPK